MPKAHREEGFFIHWKCPDAGSSLFLGSEMGGAGEAGLGMFPLGRGHGIARGGRGRRGAPF